MFLIVAAIRQRDKVRQHNRVAQLLQEESKRSAKEERKQGGFVAPKRDLPAPNFGKETMGDSTYDLHVRSGKRKYTRLTRGLTSEEAKDFLTPEEKELLPPPSKRPVPNKQFKNPGEEARKSQKLKKNTQSKRRKSEDDEDEDQQEEIPTSSSQKSTFPVNKNSTPNQSEIATSSKPNSRRNNDETTRTPSQTTHRSQSHHSSEFSSSPQPSTELQHPLVLAAKKRYEEKEKARAERIAFFENREKEIAARKARNSQLAKKLNRKNQRGQPIMKYHIQHILSKLPSEGESSK